MKATGIVRRVDDLGRIVIPKGIRRTLRIREGDPMELFLDDGAVVFKKYSALCGLESIARQYLAALYKTVQKPVVVCDNDQVVAVLPGGSLSGRSLSPALGEIMSSCGRNPFVRKNQTEKPAFPLAGDERPMTVMAPIFAEGDCYGAIFMLANDEDETASETDVKLLQAAAAFLGSQLEC